MNHITARMLSRAFEEDLRRTVAEQRPNRFPEPEIAVRPARHQRTDIWALIARLPRIALPRFRPAR